jgi:hypothetical protein
MHSIVVSTIFVFIYDLCVSNPILVDAEVNSPPFSAIFVPFTWIERLLCSRHRHVSIWNFIPEYLCNFSCLIALSLFAYFNPSIITHPFNHTSTPASVFFGNIIVDI